MSSEAVAVLGAGLMGSCLALALAERGFHVSVFERREQALLEASLHCEGKLHLGFVYAADPSFRTARRMQQGAAAFLPVLARWLPRDALAGCLSHPFLYAVHRESQLPPEAIAAHFARVREAWDGPPAWAAHRALPRAQREALFDGARIVAAFETGEPAIDTHAVAAMLRETLAREPRITLRRGFTIEAVESLDRGGHVVRGSEAGAMLREGPFRHVFNCLWANRPAVDAASGLPAPPAFLTRFKLGLRGRVAAGAAPPPSVTFVLGPYGDIVAWPGGQVFLSWYPAGMVGMVRDARQTDWTKLRAGLDLPAIARRTIAGLATLCPAARGVVDPGDPALVIDGGAIFALGETDIDDPASALHERSAVGLVAARDGHHSVDTGKYVLAPWLAVTLADRLAPPARAFG